MNIGEAIRIALQSLWANKLRSALTLLGVVIGVAAVIAVVTFVSGINGYVAEKIFRLGADVFIVSKVSPVITNIDQYLEGQKRKDLDMEDYQAVLEACRSCKEVGASVTNSNGHVKYAEQSITDTRVIGMTPSMAPIYDLDLVEGRMFNQTDMENNAPVGIIGSDIVENLMPGIDPINRDVRVDGRDYRVIGVGKKQGKTLGQSRDNYVYIPITAWLKQYGMHNSIRISGKAYGVGATLDEAIDETRAVLRARRHDLPGQPDSFAAETNQNFLSLWANLSQTFFIAMIAIAAMGARRADVRTQFLIEAITLAVVGGILGVMLGISIAKLVTILVGMPSVIKLWAVAAGMAVAASVGIFFGVYPASRAAKLDPIAALRFEL